MSKHQHLEEGAGPNPVCRVIEIYGPTEKCRECKGCGTMTPHVLAKMQMTVNAEVRLAGICQVCDAPEGYVSAWSI